MDLPASQSVVADLMKRKVFGGVIYDSLCVCWIVSKISRGAIGLRGEGIRPTVSIRSMEVSIR